MEVLICPKFVQWPVVEAGSADNVLYWKRPPYVGIVTVVPVVTHDKHLHGPNAQVSS